MRDIITIILLFLLSGCTTIIFEKDNQAKEINVKSQWHHNMVYASVEVSDPIDLSVQCPDGWSYVTTDFSFTNYLALSLSQTPAGMAAFAGGPEALPITLVTALVGWYPQTVEMGCDINKNVAVSEAN